MDRRIRRYWTRLPERQVRGRWLDEEDAGVPSTIEEAYRRCRMWVDRRSSSLIYDAYLEGQVLVIRLGDGIGEVRLTKADL